MFNPIKLGKNILDAKKKYEEFRKKMNEIRVVGESKRGLVKITLNGLKEVVDVNISNELINVEYKEELQRHIKDAINDAGKKLEKDALKLMNDSDTMDMLRNMLGS